MMLDDLKMIHMRDSQDALGMAEKQTMQLRHDYDIPDIDAANIDHVVYAGMGGSALAPLFAKVWPGCSLPFEVVRDYELPGYISARTLCVVAGYSGDTEESLAALRSAEVKGAQIVVLAGGGKLADIAVQKGYPLVTLPLAGQPRYGTFYVLKALIDIFAAAGLSVSDDIRPELAATHDFVQKSLHAWLPTVPTARNPAKQLAQELMGRSIVVYSGPLLAPAAHGWKAGFNENARQIAWLGQLTEFDHKELIGWSGQPVDKPYAVIDIRSNLENERISKRFTVADRLLSGKRPAPEVVEAAGDTLLQQLVWTSVFGDFVSVYLALLNGVDPSPIELDKKFKKAMEEK
jgi:glucose/mannose-6-phosphate isomerase